MAVGGGRLGGRERYSSDGFLEQVEDVEDHVQVASVQVDWVVRVGQRLGSHLLDVSPVSYLLKDENTRKVTW